MTTARAPSSTTTADPAYPSSRERASRSSCTPTRCPPPAASRCRNGRSSSCCAPQPKATGSSWAPSATSSHRIRTTPSGTWPKSTPTTEARSPLATPTTNLRKGLKNRGSVQHFGRGSIHRSPASGAHVTSGPMRSTWRANGWERGPLGYPTSDIINVRGSGTRQNFQGGSVAWSKATGSQPIIGAFNRTWKRDGALRSRLGYPTSKQRTG
ncbi:LGFP repeat-containing protein, partial [Arthrobacter sp. H14]|uniref:LGFP repeat-containing protein n=1 Tax=Arthrobacter sp. H14 TaxID=1312959 RepID=UPI003FA42689